MIFSCRGHLPLDPSVKAEPQTQGSLLLTYHISTCPTPVNASNDSIHIGMMDKLDRRSMSVNGSPVQWPSRLPYGQYPPSHSESFGKDCSPKLGKNIHPHPNQPVDRLKIDTSTPKLSNRLFELLVISKKIRMGELNETGYASSPFPLFITAIKHRTIPSLHWKNDGRTLVLFGRATHSSSCSREESAINYLSCLIAGILMASKVFDGSESSWLNNSRLSSHPGEQTTLIVEEGYRFVKFNKLSLFEHLQVVANISTVCSFKPSYHYHISVHYGVKTVSNSDDSRIFEEVSNCFLDTRIGHSIHVGSSFINYKYTRPMDHGTSKTEELTLAN
ncbi:hypothetical protein GCK72_024204 [Caenorhabditis remanei]|uniref:Uncharacterized protein n=1 Tax=Caenorhabditis remanei TaxID=31234 RepID=A0A6A5FYN0_CAERE|nr:hypothetical protein GCK72_024204 [Caenorhabditis remanei]KAF1747738.1 hypothetical protein GCK72_024204 [Caenorhabditis remanei]